MSIEQNNSRMEKINRYIEEKLEKKNRDGNIKKQLEMRNIDIRRDPTSEKMKSLKALVRIDKHIINMTVDTGSPIFSLNWTVAKQILDSSGKVKLTPSEQLNLPAQFVDYNKHPIVILSH